MIKQLAIRLLLGRQNRYCDVLMFHNELYIISIGPYLSFEEIMDRAVKSGVLTAQGKSVKEVDS